MLLVITIGLLTTLFAISIKVQAMLLAHSRELIRMLLAITKYMLIILINKEFGIPILFEQLDRIIVFVFGIRIFLIPNSIWYSIFGFLAPQIVFGYSNSWMKYLSQYLYFCFIFTKILYTFCYLIFGIPIVRMNSSIRIQYSDFLDTE